MMLSEYRKKLSEGMKKVMSKGWRFPDKHTVKGELLYRKDTATCEVCGYITELGAVEEHHVVPKALTEMLDMPKSRTIRICCNCHRELHTWYLIKDMETPQECEHAFQEFCEYKKRGEKEEIK